jgi:hypothetical protein
VPSPPAALPAPAGSAIRTANPNTRQDRTEPEHQNLDRRERTRLERPLLTLRLVLDLAHRHGQGLGVGDLLFPSPSATPTGLQPRVLDDLGDEAFLDDELSSAGSTAKQRTVTVVFRTSNVIVTVEYEEQAATVGMVPDSEEMQDRARKLASQLADSLAG